jgi:MOSC domain-containing protein YiiM
VSTVHAIREDLDAQLPELRELPTDAGTLELIVQRPSEGERQTLETAEVTIDEGLVGDRWEPFVEKDGSLGREAQLTIASTHLLGLIAEPERWALAGDNLLVDMGLNMDDLPAGSRLAIGDSLVVQISELPHTGCAKFAARFGSDALKFINSPEGRRLRLRGVNAKVVVPGTITVGDPVRRVST